MIESDPAFEIAAVAGTAEDAIEALGQIRVDIILLDLEMPGAGGLKSMPRIIAAAAGAKIMIVSSLAEEGAEQTVAALALGAADTLPKPGTGPLQRPLLGNPAQQAQGARLCASAPAIAPVARRRRRPDDVAARRCRATRSICSRSARRPAGSTRLACCSRRCRKRIGVPILVTQHLPAPFMPVFARQLGVVAQREALVAEDGMALLPDRIILAPGDAHLTLEPSR